MEDSLDGSKPDPLMLPTKLSGPHNTTEYCICLRVWDALLWCAIMGRPRRDTGIMADAAKTFAEYAVQVSAHSLPF